VHTDRFMHYVSKQLKTVTKDSFMHYETVYGLLASKPEMEEDNWWQEIIL
jgi:hypothetical protein